MLQYNVPNLHMISSRFEFLIKRIQPTATELSNLEASRRNLESFLSGAVETAKFLVMGSHSRGTAIRGSDLDLLQVLRRREVTYGGAVVSSGTVLGRLRQLLLQYGRTDVRRDQQALVVSYRAGHHIDVVPGYFIGFNSQRRPVYEIPDGSGSWLQTSPEAHNQYLRDCDDRSRGKLKRVVQVMKFWRGTRANDIPLNSFHVEMVLASSGVCEGFKSYSACVADAFRELAARSAASIRDPLGISGLIAASGSISQRVSAGSSLSAASDHAIRARNAELLGHSAEAVRQWQIVFKGEF